MGKSISLNIVVLITLGIMPSFHASAGLWSRAPGTRSETTDSYTLDLDSEGHLKAPSVENFFLGCKKVESSQSNEQRVDQDTEEHFQRPEDSEGAESIPMNTWEYEHLYRVLDGLLGEGGSTYSVERFFEDLGTSIVSVDGRLKFSYHGTDQITEAPEFARLQGRLLIGALRKYGVKDPEVIKGIIANSRNHSPAPFDQPVNRGNDDDGLSKFLSISEGNINLDMLIIGKDFSISTAGFVVSVLSAIGLVTGPAGISVLGITALLHAASISAQILRSESYFKNEKARFGLLQSGAYAKEFRRLDRLIGKDQGPGPKIEIDVDLIGSGNSFLGGEGDQSSESLADPTACRVSVGPNLIGLVTGPTDFANLSHYGPFRGEAPEERIALILDLERDFMEMFSFALNQKRLEIRSVLEASSNVLRNSGEFTEGDQKRLVRMTDSLCTRAVGKNQRLVNLRENVYDKSIADLKQYAQAARATDLAVSNRKNRLGIFEAVSTVLDPGKETQRKSKIMGKFAQAGISLDSARVIDLLNDNLVEARRTGTIVASSGNSLHRVSYLYGPNSKIKVNSFWYGEKLNGFRVDLVE